MGGIPNEASCSICLHVRTAPAKQQLRVLTEAKLAWCDIHRRQLFESGNEPSITFTVCAKFTSGYELAHGERWPLPPECGGNDTFLWLNRPTKERPFREHRPFIAFADLPKMGG